MRIENTIIKLLKVGKEENIIGKIRKETFYHNDEPKICSFLAKIKDTSSSTDGLSMDDFKRCSSFSVQKALLKTLGEIMERYALSTYKKKNFLWENYNNLGERAIDPEKFISFSELKIKPGFKIYSNSYQKLNWVKGTSLTTKKKIFVPSQLVFVPYRFKVKESIISLPITTGAALHSSFEKAVLSGLLEVVERDAFMISYLNKLSRNIIDIRRTNDETLKKIISQIKRYNLELYLLDISTDVPVYSVLAILIDRTGFGPAISVGIKSDLNIESAVVGAIEESFHPRPWIKEKMIKVKKGEMRSIKKTKNFVHDKKERGLLWSNPEMIKKIEFFLKGDTILIKNLCVQKTKNLSTFLKWFNDQNIEVLCVDVTTPSLKKEKLYVVKVLIPCFQPLYLDERFPCWKGKRLKEVPYKLGFKPLKRIYKFPHPFL